VAAEVAVSDSGELVDLTVGEVAHGGWCVARAGSDRSGLVTGQVVFVRHALPGERVRARVTARTARFARADAVDIVDAAPDRVPPPCPFAGPGRCGGCDWQHASPQAQRRLKAAVLEQQFRRIGGVSRAVTVAPLAADESGFGWRTRVSFAVGADGVAGLRKHRSHEIVPVTTCLIAHPGVNDLGVPQRRWPAGATVQAIATSTGEHAVAVTDGDGRGGRLAPRGRDGGPRRGSRYEPGVEIAGRIGTAPAVPGTPRHSQRNSGGRWLHERAAGRDWRLSPGTFWQVHPAAADTLAAAVRDALAPEPGAEVLDLYCGAGLFAGALAAAVGPGGRVSGVEASAAAVRDARHNLADLPQVGIRRGQVGQVLAAGGTGRARLAVLDPPRAGAGVAVSQRLACAGPAGDLRRIAYVSCDPATAARDVAVFLRHGWQLDGLLAYDAFPMTHHVECVATLTHR
jgi:tRNA/tmRNA/rRNA uracil-C5-methylase (TrmA/RlmC/RlmD family)